MIKVYSIYNKTLKQYYSPICDYEIDDLKRNFYDVVNATTENYISRCPDNYCISLVGEFNDKTGIIDSRKPKVVLELADLKEVADGN